MCKIFAETSDDHGRMHFNLEPIFPPNFTIYVENKIWVLFLKKGKPKGAEESSSI